MVTGTKLPRWPVFEPDELAAVDAVLRSGKVNYWTGSACRDFEAAWSRALGTGAPAALHSLSMANGSLTMDAALRALGIGPGDEVIVSPRSYVASAMCVVLAGATAVFADVDFESGCITPATAEAVRSPRTRAVIPVHIGGWPCDMPAFMQWASTHGLHVIEDCAQAHGGHVDGRALGTFGTFGSWSFCQDKILTTGGEGGMLCTSDPALHRACWSYSQHGKDYERAFAHEDGAVPGSYRWLVGREGTNLRMTEMQAAIGLRQLEKLPAWHAARRRNSEIMQAALRGLPCLRVPATPGGHAHYRCMAFVTEGRGRQLRDHLLRALDRCGLPAMSGPCGELYREPIFSERRLTPAATGGGRLDAEGRLTTARLMGETSLAFPVHHTIEEAQMRVYAGLVHDCIREAAARSTAREHGSSANILG
jgi:dTDP-4-amino-4,6-dideoxygalactose transaminase